MAVEQGLCFVIAQRRPVGLRGDQSFRLAQQTAAAGMGVLDVGTAFTVEVQSTIPAEVDILDPVVAEVGVDHGTDTDLTGNIFFIGQVGGFFFDDLEGLLLCLIQQVFQIDHMTLTGGKCLTLITDHAEGDMDAALGPLLAHLFQHGRTHMLRCNLQLTGNMVLY